MTDYLSLAFKPVVVTEIDGLQTRGVLRKVTPNFIYIDDGDPTGWAQIARPCIDRIEPAEQESAA